MRSLGSHYWVMLAYKTVCKIIIAWKNKFDFDDLRARCRHVLYNLILRIIGRMCPYTLIIKVKLHMLRRHVHVRSIHFILFHFLEEGKNTMDSKWFVVARKHRSAVALRKAIIIFNEQQPRSKGIL